MMPMWSVASLGHCVCSVTEAWILGAGGAVDEVAGHHAALGVADDVHLRRMRPRSEAGGVAGGFEGVGQHGGGDERVELGCRIRDVVHAEHVVAESRRK